jgi:hypothetical protein
LCSSCSTQFNGSHPVEFAQPRSGWAFSQLSYVVSTKVASRQSPNQRLSFL